MSPVSRKTGLKIILLKTPGCSGHTSRRALLKLWSQMLGKGWQQKLKARTENVNLL